MIRLKHGGGSGHGHNKRIYIHYTYKHVFIMYINIVHTEKYNFIWNNSHHHRYECGACASIVWRGKKYDFFYYNWTSIKKKLFHECILYFNYLFCVIVILARILRTPRNQVVCELTHTTKILLRIANAKSSITIIVPLS